MGSVFDSLQKAAVSFSTLCAAIAAFVMLLDAADLWVRGRKMTAYSVKMFRSLVFVAVLGALAASMLGGNSLVIIFLAPAMVTYLLITRRNPRQSVRDGDGLGALRLSRRLVRFVGRRSSCRLDPEVAPAQGRQEAPLSPPASG